MPLSCGTRAAGTSPGLVAVELHFLWPLPSGHCPPGRDGVGAGGSRWPCDSLCPSQSLYPWHSSRQAEPWPGASGVWELCRRPSICLTYSATEVAGAVGGSSSVVQDFPYFKSVLKFLLSFQLSGFQNCSLKKHPWSLTCRV